MPWFKCSIAGENFPGALIGETNLIGFFTTRFVEANSSDEAESLALGMLKTDSSLALPALAEKPIGARVYFESIDQVPSDMVGANTGFTFFPMEP